MQNASQLIESLPRRSGGWGASQLVPQSGLDSYVTIVSRFKSTYWAKSFNTLYVWTNHSNPKENGNSAQALFQQQVRIAATQILNLGCQQAPIGAIQWNGSQFLITNAERSRVISGQLETGADGRASGLIVEQRRIGQNVSTPPEFVTFYKYQFDRKLSLAYLPSTIEAFATHPPDSRESPISRLRIQDVELGREPLPEVAFSLWPYNGTGVQYQYFTSNATLVSLNKSSTSQLDPRMQAAKSRKERLRSAYLVALFAILCVAPVLFVFRKHFASPAV